MKVTITPKYYSNSWTRTSSRFTDDMNYKIRRFIYLFIFNAFIFHFIATESQRNFAHAFPTLPSQHVQISVVISIITYQTQEYILTSFKLSRHVAQRVATSQSHRPRHKAQLPWGGIPNTLLPILDPQVQ